MSTKDGGPAFPVATQMFVQQRGMFLRDYFAGQALMGFTAHGWVIDDDSRPRFAVRCYALADALLAARDPQEPNKK